MKITIKQTEMLKLQYISTGDIKIYLHIMNKSILQFIELTNHLIWNQCAERFVVDITIVKQTTVETVGIYDGISLQWRHSGLNSVSKHQPHHYLPSRLLGRRTKKTSKLRVTGLCAGNSPVPGEFPAQMASYAENVSIWWRDHVLRFSWKSTSNVRDSVILY